MSIGNVAMLKLFPAANLSVGVGNVQILVPPSHSTNLDNVRDFTNVCRTCASITEFVMPIFSREGRLNNLADKISKHLRIQVQENDELPLVLCYQCSSTLLAWHELVKYSKQADAALRAKICLNQQKSNPPNVKSSSSVEDEAQRKPKPDASRLHPQQYRTCTYCDSTHSLTSYRKHLVGKHTHRLFLCDDCDTFADKKDIHGRIDCHALQYGSYGNNRNIFWHMRMEETVSQNPGPVLPAPAPQCSPKRSTEVEGPQSSLKTKSKPFIKTEPPMVGKKEMRVQENDFSDHSDMDGFGPLPASVFEAMEDSQDSQHLEDNNTHTPENQPHSDESRKYSQPENKKNCNHAARLEKNNKFNHCSVVIEPFNINNYAQINKSIKNSNVKNNQTPPKTTDARTSDNHPTHEKEKKNQKTRQCPFCLKEFRAASSYYYHLKYVHKDIKEHECEVCGRKFNTRSCVTRHMAIHAAQREFECQQCQKQFKTRASLYMHEQTHSGKKPWSCSQCKMSFRWNTQLLKHRKRHAAEKGHVCDTCGRGFSVRSDLLRHARTHAAGTIPCDICGQKFAQLRYLKVHTAKQHSTNVRRKVSK